MAEYLRAHVVREEGQDADGPLRIIAATAGRKADGLNLAMDRVDLGRYVTNPIVAYGHDYYGRDSLPIGRSLETWVDGDRLMMDIEFDLGDAFAAEVDRKYRAGVMNTFSIGFDAHDVDDAGMPARWELHEVSAVPIPLDPDAVVARSAFRDLAADQRALQFARDLVAAADLDVDDPVDDVEYDGPRTAPRLAAARRRLALHEAI